MRTAIRTNRLFLTVASLLIAGAGVLLSGCNRHARNEPFRGFNPFPTPSSLKTFAESQRQAVLAVRPCALDRAGDHPATSAERAHVIASLRSKLNRPGYRRDLTELALADALYCSGDVRAAYRIWRSMAPASRTEPASRHRERTPYRDEFGPAFGYNPMYEDAMPYLNAGIAAGRRGDYHIATRDFEDALIVVPGFGGANVNLGTALCALGQSQAAREQWLLALEHSQPTPTDTAGVDIFQYEAIEFLVAHKDRACP